MAKKYNTLVFIGRFQPFHNGHKHVIDTAITLADQLIILVGSSNQVRSMRNPFTFEERCSCILDTYSIDNYQEINSCTITVLELEDTMYNDNKWIEQVQSIVEDDIKHNSKIALIGHSKDETSYYLKLFPTWDNVNVPKTQDIDATHIRDLYWAYGAEQKSWNENTGELDLPPYISSYVSKQTLEFLQKFQSSETYDWLRKENDFIKDYSKTVQKYPRIEHTVDAVVTQSGHILLIERRSKPGKGLLALPGGFVDVNEKLKDAMIRELREETKIKVPEPVLRGSIVQSKCYDDPHRSARARIITQAFHIELPRQTELPKIKGGDDAARAKWIPLSHLEPTKMFEDHYFIIKDLIDV